MLSLSKVFSQLCAKTLNSNIRSGLHLCTKSCNSYTNISKQIRCSTSVYGLCRSIQTSASLHSKTVVINFIDRHGEKHQANATVGDSLLEVITDNDLKFETYGVCEGTISCSTCHVILDEKTYEEMEEPLMDEMDMLDLAYGLTETSRLGCQVYVTEEMDGITVTLPKEITDARDI